jgi:hypothetical protein
MAHQRSRGQLLLFIFFYFLREFKATQEAVYQDFKNKLREAKRYCQYAHFSQLRGLLDPTRELS